MTYTAGATTTLYYCSSEVRTEGRIRQSAMEAGRSSTPVTHGEQWSDDTERSNSEIDTSPQNAGYIPLDQQYLMFEDENDDEDGEEEDVQAPLEAAETWHQSPDIENSDNGVDGVEGGQINQQSDVASFLLGAMEADYQACLASEERPTSSAAMTPAAEHADGAAVTENDNQGQPAPTLINSDKPHREEISVEESASQARQDLPAEGAVGLEGRGGGDVATADVPPRPISPLGGDRAERVMRAMQGFQLSAPALPHPRFEADWISPGALASLAPSENAGGGGRGSGGGRDGSNEER